MMNDNDLHVVFSRKTDHWATPKVLYDAYQKAGFVDPCPLFSKKDNLNRDYGAVDLFINPPYSDIKNWTTFAIQHHQKYQRCIVLLVPARTDTKWFHELLDYGIYIRFIKGRLKFNDGKNSAPFPSLLITLLGNGSEDGLIINHCDREVDHDC